MALIEGFYCNLKLDPDKTATTSVREHFLFHFKTENNLYFDIRKHIMKHKYETNNVYHNASVSVSEYTYIKVNTIRQKSTMTLL